MISDFVSAHFPLSGCRKDFRQRIEKMRETAKLEVIILDPVRIKSNDDLAVENSQRRELDADALRSFLIVDLFENKGNLF